MFLINSCLGLVTATIPDRESRPFFRSYGASLPSSLKRVLSRPLVFSTNLPVSVSGTGNFIVEWKYKLFLEVEHHKLPSKKLEDRDHVSAIA